MAVTGGCRCRRGIMPDLSSWIPDFISCLSAPVFFFDVWYTALHTHDGVFGGHLNAVAVG